MLNKKILILGASGYIGSELTKSLRLLYDVTTVDALHYGGPTPDIMFDYGCLWGKDLAGYHAIILLAGYSSVPMCQEAGTWRTFNQNVRKFTSLIDQIDSNTKFLYASSGSVANGYCRNFGMAESEPLYPPSNHYDASKMMIDTVARTSGKNYYGLRFGTVCGRSENQRMDLLYPKMAWSAVRLKKITLSNMYSLRSILWLPDLLAAICKILEGEDAPGIYNVASFDVSMAEAASQVQSHYGGEVEEVGDHLGNTYSFLLDCDKIKRTFGCEFHGSPELIFQDLPRDYLESIPSIESRSRNLNSSSR